MKRLFVAVCICLVSVAASVRKSEAGTCEDNCWDYYLTCSEELCGGKCPDCVDWLNLCLDRCAS